MADVQIGYAISSEEHLPNDIVRHARMAEEAGFTYALISDHYHPWVDAQGHSPFVWSVIGGIATATENLRLGTGVTCPTVRIHPAIIAQAAATSAAMMPGRFFLGVGTGEALNEHITGDRWPETDVRQEMLEEAIEIMRLLWQGGNQSYHGAFYTVENARLYTLPEEPVEVMIAASGPSAAELAGRLGDGLITTSPDKKVVQAFEGAGGKGPRYGQMTVCWNRGRGRGAQDRPRDLAERRAPGRAGSGASHPGPLPAGGPARYSREDRRERRRRPGCQQVPRQDRRVRTGRVRPRLHPPGRTGPGRVHPLRGAGDLAAIRGRALASGVNEVAGSLG